MKIPAPMQYKTNKALLYVWDDCNMGTIWK